MASEGPNGPSTGAQSGSDTAWAFPGKITADDVDATSVTLAAIGASNLLYGEDFGFSVPVGSTIDGMLVEWKRQATQAGVAEDTGIFIRIGGVEGTENKAAVGAWPGTLTFKSYGGSADLWSETPSVSDINASNFGAHLYAVETGGMDSALLNVDYVRITVTFTAPALDYVAAITMQTSQPLIIRPTKATPYYRDRLMPVFRQFSQTRCAGKIVNCRS